MQSLNLEQSLGKFRTIIRMETLESEFKDSFSKQITLSERADSYNKSNPPNLFITGQCLIYEYCTILYLNKQKLLICTSLTFNLSVFF